MVAGAMRLTGGGASERLGGGEIVCLEVLQSYGTTGITHAHTQRRLARGV